ncbi:hypothetical protein SAMN05421749_10377 [Acinetobacter marinus]|uniref:Uncharacterized protein n=1 Tax=Acinetobacter marinus TaxID=281375 RepID=A0A1G6IKR7_9GAMM|nr:hypothetical protein [Acinetobacter marinus]SDC07109.1 hypothetical protein SAMN05421749_10377 [Acinetobacter marinus]
MKYSKAHILKALLLTPLPLLCLTALFFIIANHEYSLYSIFIVFFGHVLIYLAYCILIVPITFLLSMLLNHYFLLNILTISLSALMIAIPFFLLLGWSHTGQISEPWWKMYGSLPAILMTLLISASYWLFLKYLSKKP